MAGTVPAPAIVETRTPAADAIVPTPRVSAGQSCGVASDTVLAQGGVGPSLIRWESPCLPDADLVYVDTGTWDLWVSNERGGGKRCLTCYGQNALGVNFPLDGVGQDVPVRWKGDPEVHPTQPILFLKAENENSKHRPSNTPSIGWDSDLWALNVCTRRYSRLTQLAAGQGLQHTALSNDGQWYVYPLRYDLGIPPLNFGQARMVFSRLIVDADGGVELQPQFEVEPNGPMYYEPNDIRSDGSGGDSLLYVAGMGNVLDPYRFDWRCEGEKCAWDNAKLLDTSDRHEEFTMFSPSGRTIAWMAGPLIGLSYHADLYISTPDFTQPQRLTWYNDCNVWPDRCQPGGAQLSRLSWNQDGTAIFYGLWIHGGLLRPFDENQLHRLDLVGSCAD